jgi:hypothetical protein
VARAESRPGKLKRFVRWAVWAPPTAGSLVRGALITALLGLLLAWALLNAGVPPPTLYGAFLLAWLLYVLALEVRLALALHPLLRAGQTIVIFFVAMYLAAVAADSFGFTHGVPDGQVTAFYSTVAQVDAALLVVAAVESAWARRSERHQALALGSVISLCASLAFALYVLGRGTDSTMSLFLTIAGLPPALVFLVVGAALRVAPELLEHPSGAEQGKDEVVAQGAGSPTSGRSRQGAIPSQPGPWRTVAVSALLGWALGRLLSILADRLRRPG